jgi:hypothetical protein
MDQEAEQNADDTSSIAERVGWTKPQPEVLPRPTYWPAALALGIIFILGGTVSSFIVSITGFILLVISLAGWIGEIRHEI